MITKVEHKFENGQCTDCNEINPNFKSDESENPGESEQPEQSEQPEVKPENSQKPNIENNQDNVSESPETGDNMNLYYIIGMLLFSTVGIAYFSKKIFA